MKARDCWYVVVPIVLCCIGCTRKHAEKPIACTLPTAWKAPLPTEKTQSSITQEKIFTKTCYRWWEAYRNPELNALMERAFSDNFTLKVYFNRVEAVLADAGIYLADLYPQITAFASADRNHTARSKRTSTTAMTGGSIGASPIPGQPPTFTPTFSTKTSPAMNNDLYLGLQLAYEVDLWGKLSMRYASAKERVVESQEEYLAARLSLSADIANYFFQGLFYTTQLALEQQKLSALTELLNIASKRFQSGLVPEDSLLAYEQTREATLSQIDSLTLLRTQAENRLAYLIGQPAEYYSLPSYPFAFHSPDLPSSLSSQVLINRPDVASLYAAVQATALDVDAAKADLLPSLIIGPSFPSLIMGPAIGFRSDKAHTLAKWKNHIWSLGGAVNYDLFDGGRKTSQVEKNLALFRENINAYQDRVLQAIKEIEDALSSVQEAKTTLKNQRQLLAEAEQATKLVQNRFTGGLEPKIDYLQSSIDTWSKEEDLHQRELTYIQATIALYAAIGGSVETPSQ